MIVIVIFFMETENSPSWPHVLPNIAQISYMCSWVHVLTYIPFCYHIPNFVVAILDFLMFAQTFTYLLMNAITPKTIDIIVQNLTEEFHGPRRSSRASAPVPLAIEQVCIKVVVKYHI